MTKKVLDRQNPRNEAMKDPSMADLDRRQLLTRAIFGSVAAAAGPVRRLQRAKTSKVRRQLLAFPAFLACSDARSNVDAAETETDG
jgi:hypothetical protein